MKFNRDPLFFSFVLAALVVALGNISVVRAETITPIYYFNGVDMPDDPYNCKFPPCAGWKIEGQLETNWTSYTANGRLRIIDNNVTGGDVGHYYYDPYIFDLSNPPTDNQFIRIDMKARVTAVTLDPILDPTQYTDDFGLGGFYFGLYYDTVPTHFFIDDQSFASWAWESVPDFEPVVLFDVPLDTSAWHTYSMIITPFNYTSQRGVTYLIDGQPIFTTSPSIGWFPSLEENLTMYLLSKNGSTDVEIDYAQMLAADSFAALVPIPPALWLFGSGLLGLIGITRRKKAT